MNKRLYDDNIIEGDLSVDIERELKPFSASTLFDNEFLAKAILLGLEDHLIRAAKPVFDSPDCQDDLKFYIECRINLIISAILKIFPKDFITEFDFNIHLFRDTYQIRVPIEFRIAFNADETNYTYKYTLTKKVNKYAEK